MKPLTTPKTKHSENTFDNMPLKKSTSDKAFTENLKRELGAGRPQKQALAIAYNVKREAGRKSPPSRRK